MYWNIAVFSASGYRPFGSCTLPASSSSRMPCTMCALTLAWKPLTARSKSYCHSSLAESAKQILLWMNCQISRPSYVVYASGYSLVS